MSYVPGDKSVDPKIHFEAGMKDFTRLDRVRFINIGGSIQYGILYSIVYFIVGITLHIIFPPLIKGQPLLNLFFWIILQCLVLVIVSFYVDKFIEAIPGFASFFPSFFDFNELLTKGFIPYGVSEYKGNMASNIVLIGTQVNLLNKVAYLTQEVAKRYFE
jgi:hypothetical protein